MLSALFVVLFVVALVAVLFALLPRVTDNVALPPEPPTNIAQFPPERPPDAIPPETIPVDPAPPEQIPVIPPPAEEPVAQPPQQTPAQPPATTPAEMPYPTREQGIFLVQVENDGADLRLTRVNRTLRVSNTPLMDSLSALLQGSSDAEAARDIISLISPDTRILSVRVEGHTAYINLNESFQFNPYGSEGQRYQIWQIVYTATEFPNVHDVQILIEGNRVDFLHEGGIMIGSPIGR